jgi:hypothetical protein
MDTRPVNTAKAVRSEGLRRVLRVTPTGLKKAVPAGVRRAVSKRLRGLNARHERRSPLSDELRQALNDEMAPEIARIEAVLGRRIPRWHQGPSE